MDKWTEGAGKKAVFFDLNGTLIDSKASFDSAFLTVFEDMTGRWAVDKADFCQSALDLFHKEQERLSGRSAKDKLNPAIIRFACLAKALEGLPFGKDQALIHRLDRTIRERQEQHPILYPGAKDILAELSSERKLALISNGSRERLLRRVSHSGLDAFFPPHRIFTSMPGKRGKPHPEVFRQAMQALGVRPGESLMIGDSKIKDVAGALRVGMDVCWFRPEKENAAPVMQKKDQGWLLQATTLQEVASLFR
ncbi:HAD family hydrolase [Gorillibacterium timonense]|uniref:HAD family hydrolase n=1 Tax=Gorillibacterium timonense TaxID=1689269 RepID=UPI00071C2943|nr:HAD family hydrolase [Gorillibacterium timonense]